MNPPAFAACLTDEERHAPVTHCLHSLARIRSEAFVVEIAAAVAAIWALGLLSLLFTLPAEFVAPSDPVADGARKPESGPQRVA
jgi:hypothetical protein